MFMRVTESSKLKTSEKNKKISLLIAYNMALEPYEITYLTLLTLFEVTNDVFIVNFDHVFVVFQCY